MLMITLSLCLVYHLSIYLSVCPSIHYLSISLYLSVCIVILFQAVISLVAQMVKHLPTMRETQVRFLDWEDPLEKEMAIHSSTLAWIIPWMEEHCRLQSMGVAKSQTRLHITLSFYPLPIYLSLSVYVLLFYFKQSGKK